MDKIRGQADSPEILQATLLISGEDFVDNVGQLVNVRAWTLEI